MDDLAVPLWPQKPLYMYIYIYICHHCCRRTYSSLNPFNYGSSWDISYTTIIVTGPPYHPAFGGQDTVVLPLSSYLWPASSVLSVFKIRHLMLLIMVRILIDSHHPKSWPSSITICRGLFWPLPWWSLLAWGDGFTPAQAPSENAWWGFHPNIRCIIYVQAYTHTRRTLNMNN